jgi:hypothetical protein
MLTRTGRPERHERATDVDVSDEAGRGPAYSSQRIFILKHYSQVPAAGAAHAVR